MIKKFGVYQSLLTIINWLFVTRLFENLMSKDEQIIEPRSRALKMSVPNQRSYIKKYTIQVLHLS